MNVSSGTVASDVGASVVYSTRMIWVLRSLCICALGISAYLAWTAFNLSQVYGCGGGEVIDCGHVLNSKWSKVLGIPVSVPAGGLYASLLVLLAFAPRKMPTAMSAWLWSGMTVGAFMAGLAALWFMGLQIFVLKHLCPYCIVVHCCGLLLAFLMLKNRVTSLSQKSLLAAVSGLGVAAMVTLQVVTPAPEHFEIITYDDVTPGDEDAASEDVFAAPGELFEAPSEVAEIFEAPGEIFEAPAVDSAVSEVSGAEATPGESADRIDAPKEAVNSDSSNPVAATVLTIVPPRLLMLSDLLEASSQQSATSEDAVPSAETPTTESTDENNESTADSPKSESSADGEPIAAEVSDSQEKSEGSSSANAETPKPAVPERRTITVAGNRVTLDVRQWPLLGRPDARYLFVEMFDYTCPHCRNTHHAVQGAFNKYGDDLAVLALPVPLERVCNDTAGPGHPGACELARIAITVWRISPPRFREFHDWMFQQTRTPGSARAYAENLVGKEQFRKEYDSRIPGDYVKRHVDMYKKVGQGSVPKLLFPKSTINGEVNSTTTLCNTIERELK